MGVVLLAKLETLKDRVPEHRLIGEVDLVVIKYDEQVSVLYGRCLHRGALMSDGYVDGQNLICGLHGWDYRLDTGVSEYNNKERLHKFKTTINDGGVYIDEEEVNSFSASHPQPFRREEYLGAYDDTHPEPSEPYTRYIRELSKYGLERTGHHGPSASMGVSRESLPSWEDIQFLPAQLSRKPLLDENSVETSVVIGPNAKNPLHLEMPVFVSDMSFGSLSREAKIALAMGAAQSGTGICSGEGGMLPEEQEHNNRYFSEYASGKFGFSWEKVCKAQAFHFKGGQGAKTGTGGHLPASKVTPEIASVRGLQPNQDAISPATFTDLHTPADFAAFAGQVRSMTGGIPIGFKIAASHIEADIDFALAAGADYIILDGRGGGTGSAPTILRDHINVPTIPALARARKHLDDVGANGVTLVITGGLRTAADFAKALMMGADAIAISNAALQAIGCLGMRACGSNNCPVGIATQKPNLRSRLLIDASAAQLHRYLDASNSLLKVIARSCGHANITGFSMQDLSTFNRDMHHLTGIPYAGVM
jgi:glutamate synthase domain-containing protein 2